ncbi:uncharacterized protein [Nicotiana tomentosiformis]|uniref:Uncharacterized protein isoform X1 n=1 Tax=Nicotiana tabacum TaxID=4097 RepID=A0A1S3XA47_TOBAC|nr:PREDICTED: uncharacterized protein LOC107762901 isoform X1 [Nicotiana tabacum]
MAFLGCKCAFEIVYGNCDKSFTALPWCMAALQHMNPGTFVEWKHDRSPDFLQNLFRYVFWAFKPSIDGFVHCRPFISIDGIHMCGKYDMKMLIAVGVDANGQIFLIAFAICANESQETWTWFINHLEEHVVKQRSGVCLISDRYGGILSSVRALDEWKELYGYYRYCVRHLKANFQRAYPNKSLHDLMWIATTDHQERKFLMQMEFISQEDEEAYLWLRNLEIEKRTLHKDDGRR